MPTIEDYDQWKSQQREQAGAQTGIVLNDARKTNPDEYAADVKLGRAFGIAPGLATAGRSVLQNKLETLKQNSILKTSPRTAQWLKDSDNARAAWDDLDNLSWFEGAGRATKNTAIRAGNRVGQMGNEYLLESNIQRYQDRDRSFSDILNEERLTATKADGTKVPLAAGPVELFSAGARYLDARYADLIGTDDRANAQESARLLQANVDAANAAPMSPSAQAFQQQFQGGASLGDSVEKFGKALWQNPIGGLTWSLQTLGESAPQLGVTAGAVALSKNPAAMAGTAAYGSSYLTERYSDPAAFFQEKGIDLRKPADVDRLINDPSLMQDAAKRGVIRGMVIGAFDAISQSLAGKALSHNPLIEAVAQSAQQAITGAAGEYAARKAAGQNIDWADILAEGFAGVATTPIDMGIAGRRLFKDRVAAANGEAARPTIDGIAEAAGASKLRQRLDSAFHDFVNRATAGTHIENLFVPAQKLQELFQSYRFDPEEFIAELPGVQMEDFRTALATGGDVTIPVADYAAKIAGTDLDAQLRDNMRFSPEDMTASEAASFNERSADIQQEAFKQAERDLVDEGAKRSVDVKEYEDLVGRLRGAGRALEVARAEALPVIAMRRTMAERAGITGEEFARRYPLPEIRGATPQGMQSRNIDELSRQLAEMRAYVAQKPNRGTSLLEAIDEHGGINDTGGELLARNATVIQRGKGKKTLYIARTKAKNAVGDLLGKLYGGGKKHGLDDVAQAMIEAGYMQDSPIANDYRAAVQEGRQVPDIRPALLEAIDKELAGDRQYAGTVEPDEAGARYEANTAYLDSLGVSLKDSDETIRAAIEKAQGKTFNQGRRGSIQFPLPGDNSPVLISLFESADLSTFLHEAGGHYFLRMLEDMATPPGVSPEIVEMYASVKDWWRSNAEEASVEAKSAGGMEVSAADVTTYIDNSTTGKSDLDAAIETGLHEQFARAFEAYALEGKAPSIELRPVFERFAQWLIRLYRNVRGLNVNLSPDMRKVFDRLLATDDEINAARGDVSDEMLFKAAETAGISAEDYRHLARLHEQAGDEARQNLRREVMKPIIREREQWYRNERASVKSDVTAKLQKWPVYRAIQELRFGKDFEGNPVAAMKIDRAILEKEYGAGHVPFLPGATKRGHGHLNAVFSSQGVHPDIVAGAYGFENGRALLDEMENVQPLKEAIDAETDRVMFERHGDVLRDGSVEEEALKAMHGDKRGQFLAAELNVLNKKVGGKGTTSQEAREAVRRAFGDLKIRSAASPRRYLASERRAANEAATAIAQGDFSAAMEAKRRQLLSYHFFMEASAKAEEVDAVISRMAKLNKSDEKLSKVRDIDYVKAARAIAGKFGLATAPSNFDMATWLEQLQQYDPVSHDALAQAISVQTRGENRSYRDLTVNEFDSVRDAIDNLMEVGRMAREVEIDGQKRDFEEVRGELASIAANRSKGKNVALSRRLTKLEKVRVRALSVLASLRRVEAWARDMDDGKAGAYVRYLVNPVMDAVGIYRREKAGRLRELLDILQPRKADFLGPSIRAAELGYTFENKGELFHAILHTGNDSNKRKLLVGRQWEKGWDAFVDRMQREGVLTKQDYDTAQAIWDLMERLKRPAQQAHRQMYGYYFNEIEPTAVETPFGTYKGGYVPAIADRDASVDGTLRDDQRALEGQNSSAMFPTTGRGFTKSRTEGYATPLALDVMMIPSHMDKVLRFTHLNPTIRQTARIISSRDLRIALNEVSPGILENTVTPWLQRTAQQAVEVQATTPAGRAFSSVIREMRRRVGVHTMFMNVVNTVQQVTGFSSAMVLVKPSRVKTALVRFAHWGEGSAMRNEAAELSAFMEDRIRNSSRELHGRIQDAIVKPGIGGLIREKADQYGYILQAGTQNVIDVIVWHAAYDQAVAGGMSQADAVREADSVIRRSMGSFAPEDISAAESGSAFTRMFTMFYSYFNGQANLVGGELQTIMRTYGYSGMPRMFAIYMFGMAIPAIVGQAIVDGARGELMSDDDDDGYLDELSALFLGSQVRYGAGMVPVAGQLFNAFLNTWNKMPYDDKLSTSPVVPAVEQVLRAPVSIYKAAIGNGSPTRATKDGIAALGLILGIPAGQLSKTAGYVSDVMTGEANPRGPLDRVQGVVTGRDGTQ